MPAVVRIDCLSLYSRRAVMKRIGTRREGPRRWAGPGSAALGLIVIFALSLGAISIAPEGSPFASWWPAAGVSVLVALRFSGRRLIAICAAIFVVIFLANIMGGRFANVAVGFAFANTLEAIVGSLVIRGASRTVPRLDSLAVFARLVLAAFAGASVVGLVAGLVVSSFLGGSLVATTAAIVPSHAAAILLIVPLGLLPPRDDRSESSTIESIGTWVLVSIVVAIVFGVNGQLPLGFLPLAALVWSATRLRFRVLQWQLVLLGVAVAVLSALNRGPFAADRFGTAVSANLVQAYIITSSIVFLTLAVIVSTRRAATRALAESELLFRENFSNALLGMLIVERRGARFVATRANAAAIEILDLDPAMGDSPSHRPSSFAEAPAFGAFVPTALASLRAAMPEPGERSADGSPVDPAGWRAELPTVDGRVIDVAVAPMGASDGGRLYALQVVDVSERANAERAMLRALDYEREAVQGLQELDRMKDELISSVSHELRTPLAGILGYTEMLLDGDAGELATSQSEMVGTIERSGRRLRRIVDDLLVISSLDGAEEVPQLQFIDAVGSARAVVAEVRPLAEAKSHRLVFTAAEDRSLTIRGIPDDIDKILVNLIGNAIKYTPRGGSIHVSVRADADAVQFDVLDNGVGIAIDDQAKVFTRFYRAETKSDEVSGTGLGLAIVDLLVRRNDGTIVLESEPDRGTRVTARFARAERPAVTAAPRANDVATQRHPIA